MATELGCPGCNGPPSVCEMTPGGHAYCYCPRCGWRGPIGLHVDQAVAKWDGVRVVDRRLAIKVAGCGVVLDELRRHGDAEPFRSLADRLGAALDGSPELSPLVEQIAALRDEIERLKVAKTDA